RQHHAIVHGDGLRDGGMGHDGSDASRAHDDAPEAAVDGTLPGSRALSGGTLRSCVLLRPRHARRPLASAMGSRRPRLGPRPSAPRLLRGTRAAALTLAMSVSWTMTP